MGRVAAGGADGVHDVDVGVADAPHVHHGHGQVLLVHLQVHRILHHTLDVLQGAGKHHAGVGLQDGQVDQVISLHQTAGQLHMAQVGAVAPHGHVDQILVGLDIVELHTLLTGHVGDAGHLIALHGVAANGGGLGDDDALGVGLLYLADHGPHHLGVGAHGGVCGGCMAGIGLEHDGGAGLDHVGNAAHQVKDLGDALLNGRLLCQGNQGFLFVGHSRCSSCFSRRPAAAPATGGLCDSGYSLPRARAT